MLVLLIAWPPGPDPSLTILVSTPLPICDALQMAHPARTSRQGRPRPAEAAEPDRGSLGACGSSQVAGHVRLHL